MTKERLDVNRKKAYYGGISPIKRDLQLKNSSEYQFGVEHGRIIPAEQQAQFLRTESELFDAFCALGNAYGLPVYPELTNPALINLESRIINALRLIPSEQELSNVNSKRKRTLVGLTRVDPGVDYENGSIANIARLLAVEKELSHWGLNAPEKAIGTHIVATGVWGYRGVLKYDFRDVIRGAPQNANAYWEGKARLVEVVNNSAYSPVCSATKLSPIDVPDGEYHIVPIKYFRVEVKQRK